MRLNRTQSKAEVAQGLERAYAGLLFDLQTLTEKSSAAQGLLKTLPVELEELHRQQLELQSQMEALAISIRRFEPGWTGNGVRAKRVRQKLSPFGRFEIGRHGLKMLRETNSALGVEDILRDICREKGVPYTKDLHREQYASVRQSMNNAAKRGLVVAQRKPLKWKMAFKEEWAGPEPTVDYDFDAPPLPAASAANNP